MQPPQDQPEPHVPIVQSLIWQGFRVRGIGNAIYRRPVKETFHEFLLYLLLLTLGEEWYKQQVLLKLEDRHVILKWFDSFKEWTKSSSTERNKVEGGWKALPTGEVQTLISLAYAIFCLNVQHKLPAPLIKRLRNKDQFQGAHYEITVAAIMARAGFTLNFLENLTQDKKRCEFIAKHKYTGIEIGVEAKSRHRKGVLHQAGEFSYSEAMKGDIEGLLRKSLTQKLRGLPYIIFFDLNLPATPHIDWSTKPWVEDIRKMLDEIGAPSVKTPDPFNGLILTNFSYYYGGNEGTAPPGEYMLIMPNYSEVQLNTPQIFAAINESCARYMLIPPEV